MIRVRHDSRTKSLVVTADNESRRDLADAYAAGGYPRAEDLAVDEIRYATAIEWVPPESIGALTSAPILGEITRDEDGEITGAGRVWWFPDYAIRDPWAALKNTGRVEFASAD